MTNFKIEMNKLSNSTIIISIHRNSYQIILFIVKYMFLELVVSAKPQRKIEEILTYLTFCWNFVKITHM